METSQKWIALCLLAVLCSTPAIASPEDDQVAAFLKSKDMLSLLEAQLEDRIERASDEERVELVDKLSELYLTQLRAVSKDDPYYDLLRVRAESLIARMGSRDMYELRIELFIELYLSVEPQVELARLELLEFEERAVAIAALKSLDSKLSTLITQLDPEVAKIERTRSKSTRTNELRQQELPELRRFRSLAHYYHAWTGYSLAMLQDQYVPNDVYHSFGWLLGAEGNMPQYSVFNESTLEFEHVARAAIGLALSYSQSDEGILARSWAKNVVYSEYLKDSVQPAAMSRYLQVIAMDQAWADLNRLIIALNESNAEQYLSVADARFLALRSLTAMNESRSTQDNTIDAKKVAKHALGALVAQGEIGHVLELYRRFDSFPALANSFISNYAQALAELNIAETSGSSSLYNSVAIRFEHAFQSADSMQFPAERDDCALKLAYCELRSNRPSDAVHVCEDLIENTESDTVIEEARWLRIAALASIVSNAVQSQSILDAAVREYIIAYPATSKSAKLILRHALQGAVDTNIAIETLESIEDDDPIAVSARRALIGILYDHSKSVGYTDRNELERIIELVRWVYENDSDLSKNVDSEVSRTQLGTTRIGLDILFRLPSPDIEFATQLIEYGQSLLQQDTKFAVYRPEFMYRQVQVALLRYDFEDATKLIAQLGAVDSDRSQSAQKLMLLELFAVWRDQKSIKTAQWIIEIGSVVVTMQSPPYPETIGIQVSQIAEMIVQAGSFIWNRNKDIDAMDLAIRLSKLVLERGTPSESGLVLTVQIASDSDAQELELKAWLLLLASYDMNEDRWYEARYESLRLLFDFDPSRANAVYAQYKALHPSGGPEKWAIKFDAFEEITRQVPQIDDGAQP